MIDNWKTSFQTGECHWMLGCFILQEWEGLDNIPEKGGALIIYYHGVSTSCTVHTDNEQECLKLDKLWIQGQEEYFISSVRSSYSDGGLL